jgi:hypothetical protein
MVVINWFESDETFNWKQSSSLGSQSQSFGIQNVLFSAGISDTVSRSCFATGR